MSLNLLFCSLRNPSDFLVSMIFWEKKWMQLTRAWCRSYTRNQVYHIESYHHDHIIRSVHIYNIVLICLPHKSTKEKLWQGIAAVNQTRIPKNPKTVRQDPNHIQPQSQVQYLTHDCLMPYHHHTKQLYFSMQKENGEYSTLSDQPLPVQTTTMNHIRSSLHQSVL